MNLRPYQDTLLRSVFAAWQRLIKCVLVVSPTGSGKTVLFSEAIRIFDGVSVAIAHRQELVGQISMALARDGVTHRIIGPPDVVREIVQQHYEELGKSYYSSSAKCAVAGVDTIISWSKPTSKHYQSFMTWAKTVRLWVQDEAHHLLRDNKWGDAVSLFPNAVGMGVTATPERADGKGLGRHADGYFDEMIVGPSMRDLINGLPDWSGVKTPYLTDYRYIGVPSDLDLSKVGTGADGDYLRKQLGLQTRDSSIVGDVVASYLKYAPGKLGVTFAPDVETATIIAAKFNEAGVPAEVVSAKTPGKIRRSILKRFRKRELLQLVNVDLFGEGFDLPAIEVVSMARATQSYPLYVQQWGRALRLMVGKFKAIIIDHVGNLVRHGGPPDRAKVWTLDRRERKAAKVDDGLIPVRNCLNPLCMGYYERVHPSCPNIILTTGEVCGWKPDPVARSAAEFVDGDLNEYDDALMAALRGEIAKVDEHPDAVRARLQRGGLDFVAAKGNANRHAEKQAAQTELRECIALWAGYLRYFGRSDSYGYRLFYFTFGMDVLAAQALGRADAERLTAKVRADIAKFASGMEVAA